MTAPDTGTGQSLTYYFAWLPSLSLKSQDLVWLSSTSSDPQAFKAQERERLELYVKNWCIFALEAYKKD